MNILCIGDIVGKPGRQAVRELLPGLREEFRIDLVVANSENSAGGMGITSRIAKDLLRSGCDVLTMGDHVWDRDEIREFLDKEERILRPLNFPEGVPGKGWCIAQTASGKKVGIINLLGRVFMRYNINCPFEELKKCVAVLRKETKLIFVDIHAEATSEKIAMGHYIDGEVSAVFGTHTHVQTADEKILSKGTAYITDLGMTGPHDSVIGQKKEIILRRFVTCIPEKFEVAKDDIQLCGVVVNLDEVSGKAKSIKRIQRRLG